MTYSRSMPDKKQDDPAKFATPGPDTTHAPAAVAEKLSALRTEDYFHRRAARANLPKALRSLKRAGADNPLMKGDELPSKKRR